MRKLGLPFLVLLYAAVVSGQEFRGKFSGMVTDQQNAAVGGARIVVTETRTGVKSTAVSEPSGAYNVPFLPPGDYEIAAEAPGFKRFVRRGLILSAGESPVIDIRLEVGAVSESVTVTEDAPLIVEANSSVGQVITAQEVEEIPVNGRSPVMLGLLAMGVLSTAEPGPIRPFDQPGSSFLMGGNSSNEMLVNGAPNNNSSAGGASAWSPPQDAVMEVRASSFESDAAYGHAGGGTVNLVTKSGTNSVHGSIYDFNQVAYLDANSFFANKAGNQRPGYNYNQFGITAGGPVWIPKIFNGKNRVFWFFGYEGLRDSDPATSPLETGNPVYFATVPTPAERTGDFSELLKANSGNTSYAIYDPATGVASGTQITRTPFPNNVIPANRLNRIAQSYLKFFPQPNAPGRADGFQNYTVNIIDSDGYDNETGKLDINFGPKYKFAFDFRHSNRTQDKNNYFGNIATGSFLWRINQGLTVDNVYTVSPTVVMDVRANWTRFTFIHGSPNDGFDPSSIGFPSYINGSSQFLMLPYITFSSCSVSAGGSNSYQCLGYNGNDLGTNDSFQLFGSLVKIRGNQSVKVGADIREYGLSSYVNGNSAGSYTFNTNWTRGPLSNSAASPMGQDLAAFLLGLPSSGSFDLNSRTTAQSRYYAFFVQDDWRARKDLTINLGLRFEHETPTTERFNRSVNGFDPAAVNSVSAVAAAAYAANPIPEIAAGQFKALGGLTFAGANRRDIYASNSNIFSPRAGVAWTPPALGRKTVLRAGFGAFVSPLGVAGVTPTGFSQTTQLTATLNNYLSPASTLSDPFPNGIVRPAGASNGASTFLGQSVSFFSPQTRNPYNLRWNFGIQRELPWKFVLEVAYIGNHSVHLSIPKQQNFTPRQFLSTSPVRDTATINLLGGSVTNPFKGLLPNSTSLNGATVARRVLLLPFPEFTGVTDQGNFVGGSTYNSLNVRLQKRFTHGMTLINNFIWSKQIDRISFLNDSDPAPEKRIASNSRPLREVLAMTYTLPVGRGKRFNVSSRIGNAIAGGWALNGSLTLQTGPVLGFGNVIYYGGPLQLNQHQPDGPAFDLSRFNRVSTEQLSDNIRTFSSAFGNLRRDPTRNLDLSLAKKTAFGERKYIEFRFETFNTTNHVTMGAPNLTPTSTAFGSIGTQANTPRRVQTALRLVW